VLSGGRALLELGDRLLEELDAAGHRLDEGHREVRARETQRDAGQPGPAADVNDPRALGDGLGDGSAVEHVPLPQPRHFPRADQPTDDAVPGQPSDIALGGRQGVPEHAGGGRRRHRTG
jgi:hypothetical protein